MQQTFNLEPHEQLDEIDLRTNKDGTVDVKIERWEKEENDTYVKIFYRTPTGSIEHDRMKWPQKKSPEFRFIRFINKTPYNLRTAEDINEDDDLWLKATNDDYKWKLYLKKEKSVKEKLLSHIPKVNGFIRFLVWPLTIVGMIIADIHADSKAGHLSGSPKWSETYLNGKYHRKRNVVAIKSAIYTIFWIIVIGVILL